MKGEYDLTFFLSIEICMDNERSFSLGSIMDTEFYYSETLY